MEKARINVLREHSIKLDHKPDPYLTYKFSVIKFIFVFVNRENYTHEVHTRRFSILLYVIE